RSMARMSTAAVSSSLKMETGSALSARRSLKVRFCASVSKQVTGSPRSLRNWAMRPATKLLPMPPLLFITTWILRMAALSLGWGDAEESGLVVLRRPAIVSESGPPTWFWSGILPLGSCWFGRHVRSHARSGCDDRGARRCGSGAGQGARGGQAVRLDVPLHPQVDFSHRGGGGRLVRPIHLPGLGRQVGDRLPGRLVGGPCRMQFGEVRAGPAIKRGMTLIGSGRQLPCHSPLGFRDTFPSSPPCLGVAVRL